MASDTPEIDPAEDGAGIDSPPADAAMGAALATGAALVCLSCAAKIAGPFCWNCGQKNDDMRRSTFVLFKDFIKDTFSFDSRMWRTLGLMAASPGAVPTNYSHGKRSRYTPPVRLFLVVSFLFFLVLGVTHTMFVAVEVRAKTAEEVAAEKAALETAPAGAGPEARAALERIEINDAQGVITVDGDRYECNITANLRFFVRPQDLRVDEEKWRACSASITQSANEEIKAGGDLGEPSVEAGVTEEDAVRGFDRLMNGIDLIVANPVAFNNEINVWLPRVMFFMAPVLALILALFIRGRNALLFDHLVLSLYSHAMGFAIVGIAILLGQFGVPGVFPVAMAALGVYFVAALKRAYGRGWIKTVLTSVFAGLIYFLALTSVVGSIIANQIWRAAT